MRFFSLLSLALVFVLSGPARFVGHLTSCGYSRDGGLCVRELIYNPTPAAIPYGVLGVNVMRADGSSFFQTSWSGELSMPAWQTGPDVSGPAWEDNVGVPPGRYTFELAVCYSARAVCLTGGDWQTLDTIEVAPSRVWLPMISR
jgi:hypothetical protein